VPTLDPLAFETAIRAGRIEPLLASAEEVEGIAARRYSVDLLGRALALADPGSVRAAERARARALGVEEAIVALSEGEPPPHAVRIPLLDVHREQAFVRMAFVEFDPAGALPPRPLLDESARDAVADALAMAARIASPPRDHDRFRLAFARPRALDGAALEGNSLAAAAFVSAVSLWSDRAVRPRIAITGALDDAIVRRVGGVSAKVRAAAEAGMEAIVVPLENEAEAKAIGGLTIVAVRTVSELLERTLSEVRARASPEHAMREARAAFSEGWRGYLWPSIGERLSRLAGALPEGRPDLQVEALARLAAARRHLGDPEGSLRVIEAAQAILSDEAARSALPDAPLTLLEQQRAMTELKLFRFGKAAQAAKRAIVIARRARLRGEWIKALGCAGLVAMGQGRWEKARAAFDEALALTLVHAPSSAARSRVYLLDALGRLGREREARNEWLSAMEEVADGDARARREKEAWVRTGWGGALVSMRLHHEALEVLDVPAVHDAIHDHPLPGLLARRHLGIALFHAGGAARKRGLHLLAGSPAAHGHALEPGLSSMGHVNVLIEGMLRTHVGEWNRDIEARSMVALASLPEYGAALHWIGPAKERATRAVEEERSPQRLASAFRALIARCEMI
jgi:tetratricopeptide (TPR) repeat protein